MNDFPNNSFMLHLTSASNVLQSFLLGNISAAAAAGCAIKKFIFSHYLSTVFLFWCESFLPAFLASQILSLNDMLMLLNILQRQRWDSSRDYPECRWQ